MLQKQNKQAFTLVELIVVITILAILWTIAFISLQWYSSQARDSKRISDIQNIKTSLEIFSISTWEYPLPDELGEVRYEWDLVWNQWVIWDNVTTNLSRNLNVKPVDPSTEVAYTYSVINNKTKYELLSNYESDLVSYNILNQTNASDTNYPKIDWNYNWLFVKTDNYYIPTPSLITSESVPTDTWLTLDNTNIKSQIITWWNNIPSLWTNSPSTWELNINLSVFTWSLDSESTPSERQEFITQLQWAYTWTSLANKDIYKNLLSITQTEDIESFVDYVVLDKWNYSSSSNDIIDTTPPEWWSFIITSNWTDEITETSSISVILNITCPEENWVEMYLTWSIDWITDWEECTISKNLTLSSWEWDKNIILKFRDSKENESNEIIKNIELNNLTTYNKVYLWMWYWTCTNITSSLTSGIDITTEEWKKELAAKFCNYKWHEYNPLTVNFTCLDMRWYSGQNNNISSIQFSVLENWWSIRSFASWLNDWNFTLNSNWWDNYYPVINSVTCE